MPKPSPIRAMSYALVLASFFLALYVLDEVFGLHYAPDEHRLNRPTETELETSDPHGAHQPVQSVDQEADTTSEESAKPTKSPYEDEPAETTNNEEGLADDPEAFFKALKARYKDQVLSKVPANKARTDIVLRYYRHPPDGNSAFALEKLGFYIHERPVDPKYADFQSNAVFYGDSVRLEDIQLVTYTLLSEGLPIKVIKPSKFGDSWKAKSIEIGTDTALTDQPTLTLQEIQNLSI